jgi:hypothetical protein
MRALSVPLNFSTEILVGDDSEEEEEEDVE